jgi:hypothetical protein
MVAPYITRPTAEVMNPFGDFAPATIHIVDHQATGSSRAATMARISTPATDELTAELDGATLWLGVACEDILLAALARTIARTLGTGIVPVDVASERHCVLDAVPLVCASARQATATEVLGGVNRALAAATDSKAHGPSEVYFNYVGTLPEGSVPVEDTPPGRGHPLEMRVYRTGDLVHVDWWYDTSRFERYTVEELTEQFPLALYEMTSDALPPF